MGKIRIKRIGDLDFEEKQKEVAKKRAEIKKTTKVKKKTARAPGLKGGERVVAVGPSIEELEKIDLEKKEEKPALISKTKPEKKPKSVKIKKRSKRYRAVLKIIDKNKKYSIDEAIKLVKKVSLSRFDGTVEAHIKVVSKNTKGDIIFPHPTGKQTKVAIANDKVLAQIEKGKLDFDILIASPQTMPKLVKYAKILGPKGLMPNPKSDTISDNPEKKAKEFQKGKLSFKCEKDAPLIHLAIGKVSSPEKNLVENLKALIEAVKPKNIQKLVISPTMGPGVKVKLPS